MIRMMKFKFRVITFESIFTSDKHVERVRYRYLIIYNFFIFWSFSYTHAHFPLKAVIWSIALTLESENITNSIVQRLEIIFHYCHSNLFSFSSNKLVGLTVQHSLFHILLHRNSSGSPRFSLTKSRWTQPTDWRERRKKRRRWWWLCWWWTRRLN